uniref:MADS-box domain-containing protein n=1 Tax=Percolomonas cosmopolitus TaxID=63605 RepID=A0A7S1PF86_9EUKA|mmetsp:Transcript_1053/g.3602  ORF Transcript_1053/g.3602 Transcript_1053/m.3602 type:complete len:371 (+) Transcript_1053:360-1472(+)
MTIVIRITSTLQFGIFKKSDTICKMTGCNVTILLQTESGNFFHYCSNKKSEELVNAMIEEFSTEKASSYSLKKGSASKEKLKKSPMDNFAEQHTQELNNRKGGILDAEQQSDDESLSPPPTRRSTRHTTNKRKNTKKPKQSKKPASPQSSPFSPSDIVEDVSPRPPFGVGIGPESQRGVALGHTPTAFPSDTPHIVRPAQNPTGDPHNTMLRLSIPRAPALDHQQQHHSGPVPTHSGPLYPIGYDAFFLNQHAIDAYRSSMTGASVPGNGSDHITIPSVRDLIQQPVEVGNKRKRDSDAGDLGEPFNARKRHKLMPFLYPEEEMSVTSHKITPPMLLPSDFKPPFGGAAHGAAPHETQTPRTPSSHLDLI